MSALPIDLDAFEAAPVAREPNLARVFASRLAEVGRRPAIPSAPPAVPPEEAARQAAQREVARQARGAWQPPEYLPEELREALLAERSQYRAQLLQEARDVALDAPGVVGLQPVPAADPDWSGGKVLGFLGEECVFAGEVVHLPSNVPHSAEALADSLLIDVFSPPSEKTGVDTKR